MTHPLKSHALRGLSVITKATRSMRKHERAWRHVNVGSGNALMATSDIIRPRVEDLNDVVYRQIVKNINRLIIGTNLIFHLNLAMYQFMSARY